MSEERWRDPAWLDGARAWIDERLRERGIARTGAIAQPHVYPWSTVLRVPTGVGDVWFKATAQTLRSEVAVVRRLGERAPDVVPAPLAADPETGWLLMADAGETLRAVVARERSLDRWYDVLARYARLQLEAAPDVADLLALGVPDRRLSTLPEAYDRLMHAVSAERGFRAAGPLVADLCAELASYGLPELLQHDDLHDGQVYVRQGQHLVLDWGDACISHPFFTLSVTLDGVLSWGLDDIEGSVDTAPFRDAYLAAYLEQFGAGVVAATVAARRLGWACRAINGHVPGDDARTFARLRMFLDGRS